MKVGILTYHHPENRNYGAMMQLFALYTTIKDLGYKPIVIQYEFAKREKKNIKQLIKSRLVYELSIKPFADFSQEFLTNKTQRVNETNIEELNNSLDAFIVGSDQVWRYNYVPNIKTFFLDFVNAHKLKIAYAASFGIDQWDEAPKNITQEVAKLIRRFNSISVRESSGVKICENFGVKVSLTLDPVFLLNTEIYYSLIQNTHLKKYSNNYIAKMLLDSNESIDEEIKKLAKHQNKDIVNLNGSSSRFLPRISKRKYQIPEWLSLIKNSDLIITDSYHCVAFCIIFKKRFICIGNSVRGNTRLENLWSYLGINGKILQNPSFHKLLEESKKQVNYEIVNANLKRAKTYSMNFLMDSLIYEAK